MCASCERQSAVRDVEMVAMKIPMITNPMMTHTKANILATKLFGTLSPYPTVVMETNAHQNPGDEIRTRLLSLQPEILAKN